MFEVAISRRQDAVLYVGQDGGRYPQGDAAKPAPSRKTGEEKRIHIV